MKITKQQLNEELRFVYYPASLVAWLASRVWGVRLMQFLLRFRHGKNIDGLRNETRFISSRSGGPDIRVRVYRPKQTADDQPLPVMFYVHGGGYVFGCPEIFGDYIKRFIETRPCIVVSPDYRKALEAPFPAGFDDCYDTLLWIRDNADILNARVDQLMIAGHSAGGGMTAALTWKARDTGDVAIAFQMPIYPMIDHRHVTESGRDMLSPLWGTPSNKLAWQLYLAGQEAAPGYAAPALNTDFSGFPPTITFVGELEPFRDETVAYVEALRAANVPVEFELFEGCFHGFDGLNTQISKRAKDFTFDHYGHYYDRYLG